MFLSIVYQESGATDSLLSANYSGVQTALYNRATRAAENATPLRVRFLVPGHTARLGWLDWPHRWGSGLHGSARSRRGGAVRLRGRLPVWR